MRYLSVAEVLEINAELMGGNAVLRGRGLLESAVARPQASAFGGDAYPDIVSQAAALLHSLVLNHPFVDGNKRTAIVAMLVFASLNGLQVHWDQMETLDFVLRLASGDVDLVDAIQFLRSRMQLKSRDAR